MGSDEETVEPSLGLYDMLGIEFAATPVGVSVALPAGPVSSGPSGSMHGGLITMIVDLAGAGAVAASEGCLVSTLSVSTSILGPAHGRVVADGRRSGATRTVGFASVEVVAEDGERVADGVVVVRLHRSSGLSQVEEALEDGGLKPPG